VRYFLPDSQDLVDPSFDFETEGRSRTRIRQRDDVYAHELFSERPFDGYLVSKGIVEGFGNSGGRYTMAQRHRLLRVGAPEFLRTRGAKNGPFPIMGDCGAFTYVQESVPPYTVDDLISFYLDCEFDLGISLDHAILDYDTSWDAPTSLDPETRARRGKAKERQTLTLDLADAFFKGVRKEKAPFRPLGVAQGWSPKSYAEAVTKLQKVGYSYIAVGGMVPLKTDQIRECLAAINEVRAPGTALHLLGVTRTEHMSEFASAGVGSFDSTSPLRQAFKDEDDNYYTMDRTYSAIRIPQVQANPKLEKSIRAGRTSQGEARTLEKACLEVMARFDAGKASIDQTLETLTKYDQLFEAAQGKSDRARKHLSKYREVLEAKPWKKCGCDVCRALGHHVILFRGAERNRRRGLHNVWTFYRRLQTQLAAQPTEQVKSSKTETRARSRSAEARS
jgi:hypothetical protein